MEPAQESLLIPFEQLPMTQPLSEHLLLQLDSLSQGSWQDNCQCLTALRSINRFWPEQIMEVVPRYFGAVCDMIGTGKTQVLKNAFLLLRELFARGRELNVEKVVLTFVGLLLKKASSEHGHLKQLASDALDQFVASCGYDVSFVIVAEYTVDKHVAVSEAAIRLLARLLQNLGAGIAQLRPETLQKLMKALVFLIDGKRQSSRNWGLEVCMFVFGLIGGANYLNLMAYTLTAEELKSMSEAMNGYKKNASKEVPPLASVLKDRRSKGAAMKGQPYHYSENGQQQGNENSNPTPNMQANVQPILHQGPYQNSRSSLPW